MKSKILIGALAFSAVTLLAGSAAQALNQTELTQIISAGTLSTDVVDASNNPVGAPAISLNTVSTSTSSQTTTATYGDNAQRVYVNNPGAALNNWNLTVAATSGNTATWVDGAKTFDFNDAAGGGATNGQLTLNPAAATVNLIGSSTNTGITKGASASFVQGTVDTITLMSADASSQDVWAGYLTGIGVSQKIPAGQAPGTYKLNLTQTVTGS